MKKLLLLAFSFLAVIDMNDPEAVHLVQENHCDEVALYSTGAEGAGVYGIYHCPNEAAGNLKTVGVWAREIKKAP